MLQRAIITAASVIALTATANAADLGSYKGGPASYASVNWSGFYAGAHAGGESASEDFTDYYPAGTLASKGSLKESGFIGGGQIGYNVQSGNFVFGGEIDLGDLAAPPLKTPRSLGALLLITRRPAGSMAMSPAVLGTPSTRHLSTPRAATRSRARRTSFP